MAFVEGSSSLPLHVLEKAEKEVDEMIVRRPEMLPMRQTWLDRKKQEYQEIYHHDLQELQASVARAFALLNPYFATCTAAQREQYQKDFGMLEPLEEEERSEEEMFDPSDETIENIGDYAFSLVEGEQFADAKAIYRLLLIFCAGDFNTCVCYAYCRHRLGEHQIACELFEKILETFPPHPLVQIYLAESFFELGNRTQAQKALEMGKELLHKEESHVEEIQEMWMALQQKMQKG